MELELGWLLLGLPLVFALGWLASRLDLRQLRLENRSAPKAYFRGLNHLLNEQQDEAIDAFIEAVQKDPDTSELHFALGNLFRRRGEYERAIRVHEHLLARADLSRHDHERAQYALAQDFLKAGLLDRAEAALHKLEHTAHKQAAWLTLLSLHERARDWPQAAAIAQQLQEQGAGDFSPRLAHYLCEQAEQALSRLNDPAQTHQLLEQAIAAHSSSARPRIQLAGLLAQQEQHLPAIQQLLQLPRHAPMAMALVASELVRLSQLCQRLPQAIDALEQSYAEHACIDIADALVTAHMAQGQSAEQARQGYLQHLVHEPSLIAAARWLSHEPFAQDPQHTPVLRALEHASRPLARYRCAACGFETQGYFWQCPGCQAWESFPPRRIEEL